MCMRGDALNHVVGQSSDVLMSFKQNLYKQLSGVVFLKSVKDSLFDAKPFPSSGFSEYDWGAA